MIILKLLLLDVFKAALAGVLTNWQMSATEDQTEGHNHHIKLLWQFEWIVK